MRLRVPRTIAVSTGALLLALSLAACMRTVSHESSGRWYNSVETSFGSYATNSGPQPAQNYEGTQEAAAHLDASSQGTRRHARGVLNTYLETQEGYYGAAFYFPAGTFRGSAPDHEGKLELMRWRNASGDTGGIRVDPADRRAYLFRKEASSPAPEEDEPIGEPFVLREGCWNWLAVRQKLSTSSGPAVNAVYLNGRQVVDSTARNTYTENDAPRQVAFGLAAVDTDQKSALDAFVDHPYISNTTLVPPTSNACEERPNILFILTDDERIGMSDEADPNPGGTTWMPTVERWFRYGTGSTDGGTSFPNAYSTTPRCCPSRASILSGRYAHNHQVKINQEAALLDQSTTVERYLKDAGYRTGLFGKFLNGWIRQDLGNPPYFDTWSVVDGGAYYRDPGRNCSSPQAGGAECVNEDGVMQPLDPGLYLTDYLAGRAVDFIHGSEADDRRPWFLHVAPTAPHAGRDSEYTIDEVELSYRAIETPAIADNPASFASDVSGKPPYVAAAREAAQLPESDPDHYVCPEGVPPGTQQSDVYRVCLQQHRDIQFKLLKSVDDLIGDVFQTLRDTGEEDNTLVILASDNGYMWGEFWLDQKVHAYQHSVRIPMFMRWPGHVLTEGVDQRLVANIDMAPTAVSAAGASAGTMDGRSLLDSAARNRLLVESWLSVPGYSDLPSWASTVTPSYQYTESYLGQPYPQVSDPQPDGNTFYEFYDFATDPWQLDNYFGGDGKPDPGDRATPDPPAVMAAQLAADRACTGASCP